MTILIAHMKQHAARVAEVAQKAGARGVGSQSDVAAEHAAGEEKCPVIRANQVILSAGAPGRLRVLLF